MTGLPSRRRRSGAALLVLGGLALTWTAGTGLAGQRAAPMPFSVAAPAPPVAGGGPVVVAAGSVPAAPTQLLLPAGTVAAVQPVVVTGGAMDVPEDPSTVGWWTGSAPPGTARGSTVLDGHVDAAGRGRGALFVLPDLAADDLVGVLDAAGRTHRYTVYARRIYAKGQDLPADLFDREGPARLVLITCGGAFDKRTRHYASNVVVFAAPTA